MTPLKISGVVYLYTPYTTIYSADREEVGSLRRGTIHMGVFTADSQFCYMLQTAKT